MSFILYMCESFFGEIMNVNCMLSSLLVHSQDSRNRFPDLWLCHAHRLTGLLRDCMQRCSNTQAGQKRGPLLDETLAKEHWLHAQRDRLQVRTRWILGQQDERKVFRPTNTESNAILIVIVAQLFKELTRKQKQTRMNCCKNRCFQASNKSSIFMP